MKKLIIFAAALFLTTGIAHAQTVDTSGMSDNDLRTLLITLIEQLVTLEQAVLAQTTQIASQTAPGPLVITGPVAQAPVETPVFSAAPVVPDVQKTLTLSQNGVMIDATYSENGTPIANVPLTLTADDNGHISHSSVADKWGLANNEELTHDVTVFNQSDFTIGAVFEYIPNATGTRTLTISGNGISQTLQVGGAIPSN